MAVPLYDTTSVILIRLREGRSPFQGDRRHFSHRLVERGLTPPQAVRTIDLVTLAGGLGALLLHRLNAAGACVVVAQTLCLLGVVAILEVSANRPERRPCRGETRRARLPPSPSPSRPDACARRRRRRLRPPGSASGSAGSPSALTAALLDGPGLLAERARPPGRRRRRARLGPRAPDRGRPGARLGAGRRHAPLPLVVDRRGGHRAWCRWSAVSAGARARPPAGDQPGLGVGRGRARLPPGPEPAADPRRVGRARRRPGRRRRSPSRSTGSTRSASSCPSCARLLRAQPRRGDADRGSRARHAGGGDSSRTGCSTRTSRSRPSRWPNSLAGFLVGPLVVMLALAWSRT